MPKLPSGLTPRIVGYWIATGLANPGGTSVSPGRGHPRVWTPEGYRHLWAMGQLRVGLGLEVNEASDVARLVAEADATDGRIEVPQKNGVTLLIDSEVFFDGMDLDQEEPE